MSRPTLRPSRAAVLVWLAAMTAPAARSDAAPVTGDTAATPTLVDVVVTATRVAQSPADVPMPVEILAASEMRSVQMARTLPDAIADLTGVLGQKTAYGQGSPQLRGFTGFRTLVLVDGIRLNNSTFRDGPNQYSNTIDAWSARRVEVVRGPGSVLYGSDAVGGVINVLPQRAGDGMRRDGVSAGSLVRYGGAEDSIGARLDLYAPTWPVRVHAGASWKDFGDLRGGSDVGRMPFTGYGERSADLDAATALGSGELTLGYQRLAQDDAWRTHATIYGTTWEGTTRGTDLVHSFDQFRELAYLRYTFAGAGPFDRVVATASHQRQDETRTRTRSNRRTDVQGVEVGTAGLSLQADARSGAVLWSVGIETYDDDVDSWRDDYTASGAYAGSAVQGPVADDSGYRLVDAFAQAQWQVRPRTLVVAGARWTDAALDARAVQDPVSGRRLSIRRNWDAVVASLRLQQEFDDRWRVFGGVAQAFRAPNLSDMTRYDTARSNEIETPVAALDPERFLQYELGVERAASRTRIQAVAFYTAIRNLIIRTPTGRTIDGLAEVTKRNSDGGYSAGLELSASWQLFRDVQLRTSASRAWGAVDTYATSKPVVSREPLDRLAPTMFGGELRWQPGDRFWGALQFGSAGRADRLSPANRADTQRIPPGGTPGFAVLDLRGGIRWSGAWLTVAVDNVFDRDYRIHGSGLNEPGRNLVVSAGVSLQ
jgi:hemoglobin/transferrin/lactoferrin receptor protein